MSTEEPLSVTALTLQIQSVLQGRFARVWVKGELTDLARPRSGHVYFALKDPEAQIRGVMWRSNAEALRFDPSDGMQVLCFGELSVYPPRGAYQLVVRRMEPLGLGALEQALRRLQAKLSAEGLFALERKRPLPKYPRRIAVITSPTGAAVRDFLQVWRQRWNADAVVLPTRVQGEGAAEQVAAAIRAAVRLRPAPDLLVVTRGGGSLEDLWAFNEEILVRAVAASPIPIISAIGHEIDVTLCDLAADVRALTPTEAAQRAAPDRREVLHRLTQLQSRLMQGLRGRASSARATLDQLKQRRVLARPLQPLREASLKLDELDGRARRAIHRRLEQAGQTLSSMASRLKSLSPLEVLARGYTLTLQENGEPLKDPAALQAGDPLITRTEKHEIRSEVVRVEGRG